MRFCLLTTFFPPQHFGGDAVFVANLANVLVADGHEVEVVHCADSFELLRGHVRPSPFQLDQRVLVHTLHSSLGPVSPILTYATGRPHLKAEKLKHILSKGFDVVHWHNLSLVSGPFGLGLSTGVRLCTLHDYWLICPTHILFKHTGEACTSRECIRCTLAHHRPPQPWRFGAGLGSALRHIDRFIAPSEFVRNRYREADLGIDPVVIPHFCQLNSAPLNAESRGGYFLYVGRLEQAKGVQNLLPVFRRKGYRLVIIGSGLFERELRKQAEGLSNVEFLGRIPHDQLGRWYAGAIATLVPSLCYETFGLTVLESLQHGTPVITSRYGALPETVSYTSGGVTYADEAGLQEALDHFYLHPDSARRLGAQGRSRLGRYSARTHLESYYQLVSEVQSGSALSATHHA